MTQTRQREDESPRPAARSRTAVLAERIPIRRIVLVTLSILITAGVLLGSWKTLTMTEGRISAAGWRDFLVFGVALGTKLAAEETTHFYGKELTAEESQPVGRTASRPTTSALSPSGKSGSSPTSYLPNPAERAAPPVDFPLDLRLHSVQPTVRQ